MKKWMSAAMMLAVAAWGAARGADAGPDAAKKYGYLGVSVAAVSDAVAAQLSLEKGEGVVVAEVAEGSPAAEAGLKASDVIVKVDDQIILADEQFRKLIGYSAPGMAVKVEVIRKAQRVTLPVKLGGTETSPKAAAAPWGAVNVGAMKTVPGLSILGPWGPGVGVTGSITLTGPDGKTHTYKTWGDAQKQLEAMGKEGLIEKQVLEALKQAMGAAGAGGPAKIGEPEKKPDGAAAERLKKPVSFEFIETPLKDVLSFLVSLCKLNVVVDPATAKANAAVTLKATDMAASNALEFVCKLTGAQFAVSGDACCIGGAEFVKKFKDLKPLETDDAKIAAALAKPVSFDFIATPLEDVIKFMQSLLKVNLVLLDNGKKGEPLTLRADSLPAGAALQYVGLLVGCEVGVDKEAVVLGKKDKEKEKEQQERR